MSKPLYVLISDGGDGSYYPCYTLNTSLIEKLSKADEEGLMEYENGIGVDGDGFHYSVIQVPDDATAESLSIRLLDDDYADKFFEGE